MRQTILILCLALAGCREPEPERNYIAEDAAEFWAAYEQCPPEVRLRVSDRIDKLSRPTSFADALARESTKVYILENELHRFTRDHDALAAGIKRTDDTP